MTDTPMLVTRQLRKRYGGLLATDDVNLEVREGEVHALIGPNGAGKSTLIAQLSGTALSDEGSISFRGRDITRAPARIRARAGMARSFQITSIFPDLTVLENVMLAAQVFRHGAFRMIGSVHHDAALRERALACLALTGLAERAALRAGDISHGEQRQLELAIALGPDPALLLLDEPMAGLGPNESQRMVQVLDGLKGSKTMLLVEHDMDAVFALADRISVLVYGRLIATGTPQEIRNNPEVQRAYLGETET